MILSDVRFLGVFWDLFPSTMAVLLFMETVPASKSMSCHFRATVSPLLRPQNNASWKKMLYCSSSSPSFVALSSSARNMAACSGVCESYLAEL